MLKRVLIWTLGLSVAAFLALIAYAVTLFVLKYDSAGNSAETREAWQWLSAEIATAPACLTPEGVRNIAAKRDWRVETHDKIGWCINRDDLSGWMSVTVEPALAFSNEDENRRYFGFDAQGCSAEWDYAIDCD